MSAVLKPSRSKSVKERVGKEEWSLRVDLAAAYQLAAIFKWTDLIYTHFSARLLGHDEFLINPYGLMFEEITASNLIRIDHDGKVLDDPLGLGYNEAGFVIHGCVHEARPEAQCVIHTHTRAGVAVSAMKCGLLPISQHSMRVQREVTYHDYEGIALDMDERTRMAKDLGKTSRAMVLRNHGLLTLGESVREAFELMYYLDCACQIQVDAVAGGMDNVIQMSESAGDAASKQFNRPNRPSQHKDWPALLRLLERKGSNYAS
ncbi:MAG: class II aldolase/adducin family protein [Betaproteobacteria bacterium]|nr:class II aldolase/adducin family protein [Betaproteobacteria bacterium]